MDIIFSYCSDIYRGTAAFSEPETAAVRNFIMVQNQNQDFLVTLSHCILSHEIITQYV